jgi:hypothetical protein
MCSTGTMNFGGIQGRGNKAKISRKHEGKKDQEIV